MPIPQDGQNDSPPDVILFYGAPYSVYSRIVHMVLLEKSLAFELCETDVFDRATLPGDYAERHPFLKIPAISHGGFNLFETGPIIRYLDRLSATGSLYPQGLQAAARTDQIIAVADHYAYRAMVWEIFVETVQKPASGDPVDRKAITQGLKTAATCLDLFDQTAGDAPFLAGTGDPTLADFHLYPMICYLALSPQGRELLETHPALERWKARMEGRASVRKTRSPLE